MPNFKRIVGGQWKTWSHLTWNDPIGCHIYDSLPYDYVVDYRLPYMINVGGYRLPYYDYVGDYRLPYVIMWVSIG